MKEGRIAQLTLREAREEYFVRNGLEGRGYGDRWVRFRIGSIPFVFPNSDERRRSVRLHDLHHVVTGYRTTWAGEAEIGGWEIASGCADHYAAWVFNLSAVAIGLVIAPRLECGRLVRRSFWYWAQAFRLPPL